MTMNSSTRRRELCIFPAFPASGMAVKNKSCGTQTALRTAKVPVQRRASGKIAR
jgi:hypothetical protein